MAYRWPVMPNTGEAQVWQGVSEATSVIKDLADKLEAVKAENEFSEFKRKTAQIDLELADAIEREPDSTKYKTMVLRADAKKNQFIPQSPLARRAATQLLNAQKATNTELLLKAQLSREKDNYIANILSDISEGLYDNVAQDLEAGVAKGYLSKVQAHHIATTAEYKRATQFAISDPDAILGHIQSDGTLEPAAGFTKLDVGHGQALRNIAEGSLYRRQKEVNIRAAKDQAAIYNKAYEGAPLQDLQKIVDTLDWADGEQKTEVMNTARKITEARARNSQITMGSITGETPEVRHILSQMDGFFDDIADDILGSEKDLRAAKLRARIILNKRLGSGAGRTYEELVTEMLDVQRMVEKELEEGATELELIPPVKTRRTSEKLPKKIPLEDALAPYIVASGVALATKQKPLAPTVFKPEAPLDAEGKLSLDVFYSNVARLKALGRMDEAEQYYNQWKLVFSE